MLYYNVVNAVHFNFPHQLQFKQHHPICLDLFLTFKKQLKCYSIFLINNKKPTKNESHRQEETLIKYCESQKVILQFKGNLKNDHVYSSFFLYFSPVITAH